jgi:epoxyqueuosine reductase
MEKKKPMNEALLRRVEDLKLRTLLTMSQEQYEQRVWPLLSYIRKENRKLWQRNAAIALGNEGDPDAVRFLIPVLEDPEGLVRGHAAWALGKIGGREAKAALEKRRSLEEDEKVRDEIEEALGTS